VLASLALLWQLKVMYISGCVSNYVLHVHGMSSAEEKYQDLQKAIMEFKDTVKTNSDLTWDMGH
jgi:hypothetical protein